MTIVPQMYEEPDRSIHYIVGQIMIVKTYGGWYYESCRQCAKKMNPDGKGSHGKVVDHGFAMV